LNVLAKLGEDGLKGRFVSEALSRRKIGGDGDFLDVLIGEGVEIDVARQPSSEVTVGVLDAALLPGRVSIAKPGGHGAHGSQQAVWAKAVSLSKVIDFLKMGSMRPKTASMTEIVSAAVLPVSRAASVRRDFRSCSTSTGLVR
jgi:hypothetical protein